MSGPLTTLRELLGRATPGLRLPAPLVTNGKVSTCTDMLIATRMRVLAALAAVEGGDV